MKRLISCRRAVSFILCLSLIAVYSCKANAQYYPDNKDNVYVHKNTVEKKIALTFDDGPHPKKTQKILDVLDKYCVKATFFVIGENARLYPEVLLDVKSRGHEIGNHTHSHESINKISYSSLIASVRECSNTINEIIGEQPKIFRPPEGYVNDGIASELYREGYDVILWRVDTLDWQGRSAKQIYNTVVNNVKCGDIILMHDFISYNSYTAHALDMLIPKLISDGYDFVTVSELIDN